jgi:guanylate kinase
LKKSGNRFKTLSNTKGKLVVISGPSGVGKGTIVNKILQLDKSISLSISCTTRAAREGEKDGVNYFFITKDKFLKMIEEGGFLEYSNHFENYYGTPRFFVEEKLKSGDVILEIDVDGALNAKAKYPDAILIMIAPPDKNALYERLKGRGTEDDDVIAHRMDRADYELSKSDKYDYVVVNDDLDQAVNKIFDIIKSEKDKK